MAAFEALATLYLANARRSKRGARRSAPVAVSHIGPAGAAGERPAFPPGRGRPRRRLQPEEPSNLERRHGGHCRPD
eukprot:4942422-Lingulodinium_polyedra.AAC.1